MPSRCNWLGFRTCTTRATLWWLWVLLRLIGRKHLVGPKQSVLAGLLVTATHHVDWLKITKLLHMNDKRIAPSSLWYDPDCWHLIHSLTTCARHQSDWNDSKIYTAAGWKSACSYERCSWAVSGKRLRGKNHQEALDSMLGDVFYLFNQVLCWALAIAALDIHLVRDSQASDSPLDL